MWRENIQNIVCFLSDFIIEQTNFLLFNYKLVIFFFISIQPEDKIGFFFYSQEITN